MRRDILGVPCDALTMSAVLALAENAIRRRRPVLQGSLNVAKLVKLGRDQDLRRDLLASDVLCADGMGIVFAGRLLGQDLPERVAGIDLMMALLKRAAERGYRPYFLGGERAVVEAAVAAATAAFPALAPAGARDGFFSPGEEAEIVAAIRGSGADMLFVALPTPAKERFLARWRDELGVPFMMGVGGAFDVLAGRTRRAPLWLQRIGLEWLWRLVQEPRRLGWRYASTNAVFACMLLVALLRRRLPRFAGRPA